MHPLNALSLAFACALALVLGAPERAGAQVSAQVILEAPSVSPSQPAALAPKGGFVFDAGEERKPLPPATQDILRQVNAIRAAGATCGSQRHEPAPPLEWNDILQRAALLHTRDMVARGTLSHTGADDSDIGQRMSREGYNWSNAGENIAAGQRSTAEAIQSWLRSPGHCSNMMNQRFTEIGVSSVASGGSYSMYHTMVLGRPSGRVGLPAPAAASSTK